MLIITIVFVVLLMAVLVYIQNLKDVYFGYGQALVYILDSDAVVNYGNGVLKFEFREGRAVHYMDDLADSVYKLLIKNGFGDKVNAGELPTLMHSLE